MLMGHLVAACTRLMRLQLVGWMMHYEVRLAMSCFSCMCRDRIPGVLLSGGDGQQWALESATSPGLFLDIDNQVGQSHVICFAVMKPSRGAS